MQENSENNYEPKKNSRTLIIAIILLIIFILILILFLFLIRKPTIYKSDAYNPQTTETDTSSITPQSISFDNSYLFASPLKAKSGGQKIRLTAYILDGQGMGIPGKSVTLGNGNSGLNINPITPVTDNYGRATFDVSANSPGLYIIEASIEGKTLSQKVSITFE